MSSEPSELEAHAFALRCHQGQKRKWTGEDYIQHPRAVVRLLQFTELEKHSVVICSAYLHDVIEDCGITVADIYLKFGRDVANIVDRLSDTLTKEDGNRAFRKAAQAERLANSCSWTQSIKYADILDNWDSIKVHDTKFAPVYREECKHLCAVMDKGNLLLRRLAIMELTK